ncbi:MAG: hypothetical protein QXQ02_03150 [Halobacteria archaeon]
MHTIVAWSESVAADTTQTNLNAVPDEHVRVEGDNIMVPDFNRIIGYYANGENIQNVQLSSPSLRRLALVDIAPVENSALPESPPDPICRPLSPLTLDIDESLSALAGNADASSAHQENVVLFLSNGPVTPVNGEIITIRTTATAPATAYAWANAPLVFSQTLPVGTYDLVGARCEQANTIAFRFVFIGGIWRPGMLAVPDIDYDDYEYSRFGALGVWGTFSHNRPPSVDFFGDGTGGSAVIYLDLIKRG